MNIAIVTGASSGMGREFVTQLSQYVQVDEIWVIARRKSALESLQKEVQAPIRPVVLDLCEAESFPILEKLLAQERPNIRLLVNAAGFGKIGAYHKIPTEEEAKMIDLNCKALVLMTRLVLPYMERGSHILQLDSLSAFQPVPFISTYAATKSFVLSYSRAMNRELKPRGIRMMAMSPGWVKTEFFNRAVVTNGDNELQHYSHLWEAKDVVATGLKDLYRRKKDYSVHGFSTRMQVRLVKLLPHSIIMNIWLKQQKKPKNNRNLTVKERE
ncbi:MAG: SDR family NAD(P)-dependent oxidoreductase [Oscillospiraceae bacterium]|nr:SDR family NAD(P)-dependent oxidoreductase [Oscillospiraceae bacterium]